ncbi:MAG: S46 family peptidase, partial [Acidobacteriota bacterium]
MGMGCRVGGLGAEGHWAGGRWTCDGFLFLAGLAAAVVAAAVSAAAVWADEGMWLPNNPPLQQLAQSYRFTPPAGWLDRLQRACVRMDASGSIVSGEGLVMTNHHVGFDQLQKLSTADRNLLRDGFYAPSRDLELPCLGLAVQVLRSIDDVTSRILAAAPPGAGPATAWAAMRREMARIEGEQQRVTGLDCEVVSIYQGARFHLYRYDRYDDVRLVMAPEEAAANFGGDTDNFEYPRFAYDICFFRLYREGKPVPTPDHLRFSQQGV